MGFKPLSLVKLAWYKTAHHSHPCSFFTENCSIKALLHMQFMHSFSPCTGGAIFKAYLGRPTNQGKLLKNSTTMQKNACVNAALFQWLHSVVYRWITALNNVKPQRQTEIHLTLITVLYCAPLLETSMFTFSQICLLGMLTNLFGWDRICFLK